MSKEFYTVAVSGGFDPVHVGHLRMLKKAKEYGDTLVVILNNDKWLERKKGKAFMNQQDRAEILRGFSCVDCVYIQQDDSDTVCEMLKSVYPGAFINGGDRESADDVPEAKLCQELGIKMIFGVGGKKVRSSSVLLSKFKNK